MALKQYRKTVSMRIVAFTGFDNCFEYLKKKKDSYRSADYKL